MRNLARSVAFVATLLCLATEAAAGARCVPPLLCAGGTWQLDSVGTDGYRQADFNCNTTPPSVGAGRVGLYCLTDGFLEVRPNGFSSGYKILPSQAKRCTSQLVKTNNTLTDIPGLTGFDIENGKRYLVDATIYATAANATMDMQLQVVLASAGCCTLNLSVWVGASSGPTPGQLTASGSPLFIATSSGWSAVIRVTGIVSGCSSDTTLAFQAAQNTTNASNLTVEANYSTAVLTLVP